MNNQPPKSQRRLGRGLTSLLGSPVAIDVGPAAAPPASAPDAPVPADAVASIADDKIIPNPSQPRRHFDERTIVELAESIKAAGVMQPLIVRRGSTEGVFELVAGERRWRAAKLAGLARIPALVRELSDAESAQWALIENLQREDLGPMEKAAALRSLVDKFGLTHSEAALRVGLDRTSVTNFIRLLDLEPEIASALENKELTMGHGRALLGVPSGRMRLDLAAKAVLNHWSVRRLEQEAADAASAAARGEIAPGDGGGASGGATGIEGGAGGDSLLQREAGVRDLERQLSDHLGTKVRLMLRHGATSGRIVVEFFDLDHFDGLMHRFGFKAR